ncbi:DNA repair protein RecO [Longirhabdus pacifica]|uniref:DNA repair protein RecO n=1 Tax=Longirhabdus pacifica TaxID=2305227 RepID=UPI0013E8A1F4|nr:DNA repair protein RecO [Longirhabdus pacifica]
MIHNVEGIVIRTTDYGEGNKIITILSEQGEKVSLMARGARKSRSRLSSVTQLFTEATFTFYRSSGMGTLKHGEAIQHHHALRADLYASAYSSYIVELLDRLMNDEEASAYLYQQLQLALQAIEQDKDPVVITQIVELKMLKFAGYDPVLHHCARCGEQKPLISFSPSAGGGLCSSCSSQDTYTIKVTERTLKMIYWLQHIDLGQINNINVSQQMKDEVSLCIRHFYDMYIPIKWKARNFIDQLNKWL